MAREYHSTTPLDFCSRKLYMFGLDVAFPPIIRTPIPSSHIQSHRWQSIAALPEKEFEGYIRLCRNRLQVPHDRINVTSINLQSPFKEATLIDYFNPLDIVGADDPPKALQGQADLLPRGFRHPSPPPCAGRSVLSYSGVMLSFVRESGPWEEIFTWGGAMIVGEYHSLWVILLMVSILALFGTMWVVGGPPGNIKD